MIQIAHYSEAHQPSIIDLILGIQQNEFNIPITLADQPDLLTIPSFYCQNKGAFWVALNEGQVVGTIALIDIGDQMGAIRKMFVHQDFRGKELGIATLLLNAMLEHCRQHGLTAIYLGTLPRLQAAMRFYEKNGFVQLPKSTLPPQFPAMTLDTVFYEYKIAG
ncbi:GNAT family N-acetyltransferase [Runella aurantiaca]|uniref:GNAT family N-acetyltransferase n=1 Tax=Runella aurantiaca TaxID=2282308 RepID=A0A369ICZ6_9BACT|nr:GNAT family N-acetyltransferase [Runella aurantiaca]RDB07639.1 GNAT family N-acetyltransferase [Runella aurantiaca]